MSRLRTLAERALAAMKADILAGRHIVRTVYAEAPTGSQIIVWPSDGPDSQATLHGFRLHFLAEGVTAYVVAAEAWTSVTHSRADGSQPMDDPNRGESIIAVGCEHVRGESGAIIERRIVGRSIVTRNPTRVEAPEWMQSMTGEEHVVTGRMTMLLPDPNMPPLDDDQKAAVRKLALAWGQP